MPDAQKSACGVAEELGPVMRYGAGRSLLEEAERDRNEIVDQVHTGRGVLFRGYAEVGERALRDLATLFCPVLSAYEFGSTPRSDLGEGVYTSTEYPAHQSIPLHNEQSYTKVWPTFIWFHALTVAEQGGETPLADSRSVYRQIDPAIRERFANRRLRYVRNYGNGLDVAWEQVFGTEDKAQVEAFCRQRNLGFEWREDDELRTWEVCHSELSHPLLGERVWFNQAHLFHVSALDERTRKTLLSMVDEEDLPRNVYYGDGSAIESSILSEIRAVYAEEKRLFQWQAGDFLMLDNVLTAHGREPFQGERRVAVAMASAPRTAG
ncbi:MAG: TauD/TfdA family dioxygenase [Pseudomonadota bacterium]